jgi:hypothetical protein
MVFSIVDDAQIFYNGYGRNLVLGVGLNALKGVKTGCDHLIWRDFEYAHARKANVAESGEEGA